MKPSASDGEKPRLLMPALSLFASTGTLLCCALPALMVSIGAGASLAGLVSTVPWLVTLSKYKIGLFGAAGILLCIAGALQWRSRYAPCPADPVLAKACGKARKISLWVYGASVLIYLTGFFFAFIAVHIFY